MLLEVKKGIDSEQVQNYLALAREFQEKNLYQKAEDTLLVGLEKLPNHPFLLTRLANFYIKTDRTENALDVLNRLIKNHKDFLFSYYLRGMIYEEQKEDQKAISDYKKALTQSEKDSLTLSKLVPLLIENKQTEQALKLISQYRELLNDPQLFPEMEAEALVELNKKVEAFNKMRSILMRDPGNKNLLQKYLQLSIQAGKKSPFELYDLLNKTVPQLSTLSEEELTDAQVDYLIHQKKYEEADEKIFHMIMQHPERFHWRKKNILLKKELGRLNEIVDELEVVFLYNPRDVQVSNIFDDYFFGSDQVEEWKKVIRKAKKIVSYNGKFYIHLRDVGTRHNLLSKSPMDHNSFIENLENLELREIELDTTTYKMLPFYALETFIIQLSIEDRILTSAELWNIIYKERISQDKEIPFQVEDLHLAYPVWLLALQFYFLFKTYSNYNCHFQPLLFQQNQIALIADANELSIQLDIRPLLEGATSKSKPMSDVEENLFWHWPEGETPERTVKGIPIYSESQFQRVLQEFEITFIAAKSI